MKKLIIARHAKSSWKDPTLRDFYRPLNKRGKIDGPIMSNYLGEIFSSIDLLHSSSSVRTFETSDYFTSKINFKKIKFDKDLYHSSSSLLVEKIRKYSNDYNSVMIIAHNPGLTNLINLITNIDLYNLPTTGTAVIEFNCYNWNDISKQNSKLVGLKFPKQLK